LLALQSLVGLPAAHAQEAAGGEKEEAAQAPAENPAAKPVAEPDARPAVPKEKRVGRLIRVPSPITDKVEERIHRVVERVISESKQKGEWPVFIFEIEPGRANFGQALDLANFISGPSMTGATTVAWIPKALKGHAVLVAMACDEIVMSPDAEIGQAAEGDAVIEPSVRSAYAEVAKRRMSIPSDVALAMLDPATKLVMVETDVSREFVLDSRLEELRKQKAFGEPKVIKPAGQPGVFTGTQAWELGFVKSLADDRAGVAKALGLPRAAIEEDPSLEGDWRAVRVDIKGPINDAMVKQVEKKIQTQITDGSNFFCIYIDSAGGSPTDSINLANFLARIDSSKQRTVAYIPTEARGDAAYIALSVDQIVMHPGALLGGAGDTPVDADVQKQVAPLLRGIATLKNRSPALAAAFGDPNLEVSRYTRVRDGLVEYYEPDEVAALKDADGWQKGPPLNPRRGQPLQMNGDEAELVGLTRTVVRNFNEFKAIYGLEADPELVEPGWAHTLIDALNSPGITWLLLLVGGAALYAELQSPGIGLGGLIAALCFLLYFWVAYLGGTAGWLEALLFVAGIACLLLEIFVLPGTAIFGLTGGLLIITSLVLASQTFVIPHGSDQIRQLRNSLLMLTSAGGGVVVLAVLINRYLPHTPMFNRLMLAPPTAAEASLIHQRESIAQLDHLLGQTGVTTTPLLPSGKALFGDQMVDVIADGEVVERDQSVRVVEVRGNRVLVRQVT
jgi:membrane-bound serine protease (ClpP class)